MNVIEMKDCTFDKKVVAIVQFGPATSVSGFRPAEYYQVTIDPCKVSADGGFIRFGTNPGDEIVGWQRIEALTVCEVLGEWTKDENAEGDSSPVMLYGSGVTMRVVQNGTNNDVATGAASGQ